MANLSAWYEPNDVALLISECGLPESEIAEYVELDFIGEGDEIPSVDDLVGHIEYQQRLCHAISWSEDSDIDFDEVWSMEFAGV